MASAAIPPLLTGRPLFGECFGDTVRLSGDAAKHAAFHMAAEGDHDAMVSIVVPAATAVAVKGTSKHVEHGKRDIILNVKAVEFIPHQLNGCHTASCLIGFGFEGAVLVVSAKRNIDDDREGYAELCQGTRCDDLILDAVFVVIIEWNAVQQGTFVLPSVRAWSRPLQSALENPSVVSNRSPAAGHIDGPAYHL